MTRPSGKRHQRTGYRWVPSSGVNGQMPLWPSRPFQVGIEARRTSSTSRWSSDSVLGPAGDLVGGRDPLGAIHAEPAVGVDGVTGLQHGLDVGVEPDGGRRTRRRRSGLRRPICRRGGRCRWAARRPKERDHHEDDAASW